ncbi:MAG: hypothetical protein DWI22_20285 [Planctomycetota bacterium]|nr:MAG: hypothetical protein DWI22_20285 [Planctomycetota bacterium]
MLHVLTTHREIIQEVLSMAKNKQTGISYREHEIKEDHSFGSIGGKTPGVHKRYFCKVVGRTVKGTLDEVKANIDFHLDNKKTGEIV